MPETPDSDFPDALTLGPLSMDRIREEFARNDIDCAVMGDDTVTVNLDHNLFFCTLTGEESEILTVRGDWHQRLPIDLRARVLLALDEWHRDTLWPKGFTQVDDDGHLWIAAELSVDFEHGVTDGQLHQTIVSAVAHSLLMFEHLGERFSVTVTPRSE